MESSTAGNLIFAATEIPVGYYSFTLQAAVGEKYAVYTGSVYVAKNLTSIGNVSCILSNVAVFKTVNVTFKNTEDDTSFVRTLCGGARFTEIIDTIYTEKNEETGLTKLPEREGFIFSGFVDENNNDIYYVPSDDCTLTVRWKEAKTISFIANYLSDGRPNSQIKQLEVPVSTDIKIVEPTWNPNIFYLDYEYSTKESFSKSEPSGYKFDGWYFDSAYTQKVNGSFTVNADTTLYAKWKSSTPVISFNLNGGKGQISDFYCESDKSYFFAIEPSEFRVKSDNRLLTIYSLPSKEGYKFAGWYLDNETFEHSMNNMANAVTITEPVTVYAKWVEDNTHLHQISFNVDGNIIDTVETESAWIYMRKHYDAIQICSLGHYSDIGSMSVPVKENYVFDGWYLDSDCTKSVTEYYYATFIDKDITVYAKWAEPCIISFQSNCESTIEPIVVPKGITICFALNESEFFVFSDNTRAAYTEHASLILPIKDGKIFGGWYSDSDCQNSMMTYTGYTTITENITVYGKWIDPCYVSFNVNGGDPESEPEKLAVIPGEEIYFGIRQNRFFIRSNKSSSFIDRRFPTKEGWLLGGWYTDDKTKVYDNWDNALTVNEDITVNALWVEPCEITFDSKGGTEVESLIVAKGITLSFTNNSNSIYIMLNHKRGATWFGDYSSLPRKAGYAFDGWWYLDENGEEHSCNNNDTRDESWGMITINGPVTLYAKWK